MADFSTPFDDFSGSFGRPGADGLDLNALGPLDADDAYAERRKRLLDAVVSGETGVQFESLALFAEPLFTLYDLEPGDAFAALTDPSAVSDDVVALLETARVLWAFFSLPVSERAHRRQALAAQLVGEEPDPDEWLDLEGVIESVEVHWKALSRSEIEMAEDTGHPTLDFDGLLAHPAFRIETDPDPAHAGFGEGGLSETEARALFAQPLLDSPEVLLDEDAFEGAISRADAYWQAAARGLSAEAVVGELDDERATLEEARMMLARHAELFPKHARSGDGA